MEFGAPVRVAMTKWGERPHWTFAARWLGSDEHGDWLGITPGTPMSRPGLAVVASGPQVCLAPTGSSASTGGWLATFHLQPDRDPASTFPVEVYVDIATQPVWDGSVLRSVDLDLDVVRGTDGRVWIDDEDEFAEHQVTLDYPPETVEHALASCAAVHRAVVARETPYDSATPRQWGERLTALA